MSPISNRIINQSQTNIFKQLEVVKKYDDLIT